MVQKGGGGFSDSKEGEGLTVLPTGIYSLLYSTLLAIVVVVVVVTSYLAASFFFFFFLRRFSMILGIVGWYYR